MKNRKVKQPQQERVDQVADQVEGSSDDQAPVVTVLRHADIVGRERERKNKKKEIAIFLLFLCCFCSIVIPMPDFIQIGEKTQVRNFQYRAVLVGRAGRS